MADNPLIDLYSGEFQQAVGPHGVPRISIFPPKDNPLTDLYSAGGQHAEVPDQVVVNPSSQAKPQPQAAAKAIGQVVAPELTKLYTDEFTKPPQQLPEQGKIPQVGSMMDQSVGAAMDVVGLAPGPEKLLAAPALAAAGGVMHGAGPIEGAKALKSIFNPTGTPLGKEASMALRKATGESAQSTAQTVDVLGQYSQQIDALSPQDRLGLIEYAETRSSRRPGTIAPELQAAADEYRKAMEKRQQMIANAGIEAGVIKDFVSHAGIWKDPRQAERVFGSAFKQGSGAALKKRTIPTISDGIALGLEPVTDNLLEIGMRYVTNMDRHIALHEMLEAGQQAGHVIDRPADMRDIPEGWVELKGMGRNRYAAPEWATIWNNFVSRGVYENPAVGTAYQGFRNLSNLTTQTILGFSGYHAVAMAKEAVASDLIKGFGESYGGASVRDARQILRGVATMAKSPAAFVQKARTGKKFAEIYLGRTPNTIDPRDLPNWKNMAKVFAEAGGRAVGKSHAQDFSFTAAGNFSSAWKRGFLKAEMAQAPGTFSKAAKDAYEKVIQAGGNRQGAMTAAAKASQAVRSATELISRSMSTLMAPLFDKYIPLLKNGAFADEFQSWLKMNPNATHEQQVQFAAKLIDSIDNRFGEMIQDNIFWHTTAKQLATIGMLSYSWNLGSARLIVGGMKDISRTSLNPMSPNYSPNAAWIVAYPMAVALAAAMYQYAKTGKGPEKPMDLIMPQTGGTAPGFGQHGTVPQIAILPGYEKEPFGWFYNGVLNEATNKANPFARMLLQGLMNSDWKGDPIGRPFATVDEAIADYLTYFVKSTIPITLGRIGQGEAPGSAMGLPEQLTGIRPGPLYEMDPKGYAKGMSSIELRKWDKKIDYDVKHHLKTPEEGKRMKAEAKKRQSQYGGPQQ